MAVARPLTPAERHAYLARVFAGDLPRRVRLTAQLRADDAAHHNTAAGGNLNDIPSTALLRVLVAQIRRTLLFLVAFGAGEVGGLFLRRQEFSMLTRILRVLPDLGLVLIAAFVVYLWCDGRRWLLGLVFVTACCHGYFLTGK